MEQDLARRATPAFGVVTRRDLLGDGVTLGEIRQRMRTGALIVEHPGVYRVGHRAPSVEATYLAAVLACGEGALLSGRAAAYHQGILQGRPPVAEVSARTERRLPGVVTHRCRLIHPRDRDVWRGIPVTTVARTLVDIADALDDDELARAVHEAGVRHGTTPAAVAQVMDRLPNRPGRGRLRRVLFGGVPVTLSALERRFLRLLRDEGLPQPQANVVADGRRVDCRWPRERLTIELDGYRYHHSRHAWELDRRREREARARGDEFRRYTYGDVCEDPGLMLTEVRGLLRQDSPA